LNIATPDYLKPTENQSTWRRPRGVFQKNIGLQWIRSNTNIDDDALVYFADDDNTYHWKLFQEVINWLVNLLEIYHKFFFFVSADSKNSVSWCLASRNCW
jgi:hypothetical protein